MVDREYIESMLQEIREMFIDIKENNPVYAIYETYVVDKIEIKGNLGEKVEHFVSDKNVEFIMGIEFVIGFKSLGIERRIFELSLNFFESSDGIDAEIGNILLPPNERGEGRLKALLNKMESFKLNGKFTGNIYINDVSETEVWNDLKDKYNGKLNIIKVN
ncbi:TPA: hypothetical protein QCR38_003873 [Bacillus cereus]|nr:hypothetical protein [Bacillus cereus]